MKTIKKFFQLLVKQGLYRGRLFLEGTEYRFSAEKGFEQIEGQEVKIPALKIQAKKQKTIKREAVAEDEAVKAKTIPILSEKSSVEQKKNNIFSVISFVVFFAITVVAVYFGIKFFSKKPTSLQSDHPKQTATGIVDKEQNQKKGGMELTEKTTEYQKYINQARDYIVTENLEKARETLGKAKSIDDNEEIKKLEIELNTLEKLRKKTEKEKKEKAAKPQTPQTIKTVLIRDLSTQIVREYLRRLQNIRINLPKKINASGYINMKLEINEKGYISIPSYNDAGLTVTPVSKKGYVVELIKSGILIIQFPPPKDKRNRLVKVGNWRLNFQVTQYKQRMIIRKR